MAYLFSPSPNFTPGGITPRGICCHITAGSYDGAVSWFQNPAAQVSAHFVVAKNGRVVQMVKLTDTAWAQGITSSGSIWSPVVPAGANPNKYLISIEHEGNPGDSDFMNPTQYAASLNLCIYIAKSIGWTSVTRDMIVGHYQFDRVNRANCPSAAFPFSRLINDININLHGEDPAVIAELQATIQKMQGQLDAINGVNSELQKQLNYCQDLKFQVEDTLSRQVWALQDEVARLKAASGSTTALMTDLKALVKRYGG